MARTWRFGHQPVDPAAEQDYAAGGRENRKIHDGDGNLVTGSIDLKVWGAKKQVYAYLRFKSGKKTTTQYIGQVTRRTRKEALEHAWALARARTHLKSNATWAINPQES